jgi:hypothetical protein
LWVGQRQHMILQDFDVLALIASMLFGGSDQNPATENAPIPQSAEELMAMASTIF